VRSRDKVNPPCSE